MAGREREQNVPQRISLYQAHCERWKAGCGSEACPPRAQQVVFARGSLPCDILFIGEAPGASENVRGIPFDGPAGMLLDKIITQSIGAENDIRVAGGQRALSWAMYNLVGCIPLDEEGHKSGEPEEGQIRACLPRLIEFVRIARPRMIVLVGRLAKKYIHGSAQFGPNAKRAEPPEWIDPDKFLEFVEIIHPAAILRGNVAQQGMAVRRCIAALSTAVERL